MRILICNERFLFRFGLDRALILIGRGLKALGHSVTILANKYDYDVLDSFATRVIDVPEKKDDYLNGNEFTKKWLVDNWNILFDANEKPDIVLVGGWPFFSSISFFSKIGIPTIFLDCGAVPLDGYSGGILITQKKIT